MTDIMNRKEIWRPVKDYIGLYEVSNIGRVRSLNYNGTGRVQVLKPGIARGGYLRVILYKNGKRKRFMVHRLVYEVFVGPIPDGYELDHIDTNPTNNCLSNLRCVTPEENRKNQLTIKHRKEAMKKLWSDPEFRKKQAEAMKKVYADPEWQRNAAEAMKKHHQDPEFKKKLAEGLKKRLQNDDWRRNHAEAMRKANSKPVVQIDKETGELIRRWDCVMDVERELGINHSSIASCCNKRYKTAGNFVWKYA